MGNTASVCSCSDRPKSNISSKSINKHHFTDGCIKVVDYTGMFPKVKSIKELKSKMVNYLPFELQCIRDTEIDPVHSFVRVIGIQSDSKI